MVLNTPITVVAIDDDPMQLRLIEHQLLTPHPGLAVANVLAYTEASEALANLPASGSVVILCDLDMPDGSGLDWLKHLTRPDVGPVLILTATGDEIAAAKSFREGASDYLIKSDVIGAEGTLHLAIADALRRYKLAQRNKERTRELKLANQELRARGERLAEMTRNAHRFVDDVAHEFRTPLTVIREFTSIIHDGIGGEVTPKQAEFLDYIDSSARDLGAMVDDFLDSSKLKAGTLRVLREAVSVASIFEHIRPTLETRAQAKSVEVVYEIEPDLPEVFVDAEKIGRIATNLVVNAIKFSPDGSTVHVRAEYDGNGHVQVAVRDHGVGISEEQLPELCKRFSQVGDPRQTNAKGFGLGLNIARDLVWLNLGDMKIESTFGEGSTFSFTMPVNDLEHIVRQYTKRTIRSEENLPLTLLAIQPINPKVTADEVAKVLSSATRSMDLFTKSQDGQTVFAIGPADAPDAWISRLKDAAEDAGQRDERPMPLKIEWLGTWAQPAFTEHTLPLLLRTELEKRACA